MTRTIKSIHVDGEDLQYDYSGLANAPTISSVDSEMSDTSTNGIQNKVVKTYIDEGDMYPIAYKTTDGTGTIYAYKDASSDSYDTITVSSKGGVVWIDRNYERIEFISGFKSFNLSRVDTRNITNMGQMFSGCRGLTSLDLSSFDTTNVTSMVDMFYFCSSLTSLDLSFFDTTKVTNMGAMFNGCSKLTSLDLSSFNTSSVTDMSAMFYSCYGLTSLDLSSFDTTNVTDMSFMFAMYFGRPALTKLTVSSSFFNSTSLTTYDFSSLTAWTDTESLANFVSVLPTITTTKTLQLSSNTKSALTEDQISTITTTKGWTIA